MKKIFFCFLTVVALVSFSGAELWAKDLLSVSVITSLPCIDIQNGEQKEVFKRYGRQGDPLDEMVNICLSLTLIFLLGVIVVGISLNIAHNP